MSAVEELYYSIPKAFQGGPELFDKQGESALIECIGDYVEYLEHKVKRLKSRLTT